MSWLFQHKFISLLIIAGIFYWVKNPSDDFGYSRPGLVIYNRIPVFKIDCYISPTGKLNLEADLSQQGNVNYWLETHCINPPGATNTLLVGTGFTKKAISFTPEQLTILKGKGLRPVLMPSVEAIGRFTLLRKEGKPAGILLKVN